MLFLILKPPFRPTSLMLIQSILCRLKAGSVITIEPGIYVPEDDCYPAQFRGIGSVVRLLRSR